MPISQVDREGDGQFVVSVKQADNSPYPHCATRELEIDADNYGISVELKNDGEVGNPGVIFNAVDFENYDFVYFA